MEPRESQRASRVNRESDVADAPTPRRYTLSIEIKREKGTVLIARVKSEDWACPDCTESWLRVILV